MNNLSPALFGRSFGEITSDYMNGIGKYISPVFHILTLVIIILIITSANKNKNKFTLYFLIDYVWIFLYVGLYMSYLFYEKMGIYFLIFWGAMPFLLLFILFQWFRELKVEKNNFSFKNIPFYRYVAVLFILFGFWYPTYIWGSGFKFLFKDFLFSSYGLMPCPTTIVVLGLLTLKYPDVNKGLFYSLTLFSVMVGTAQFTIGFVPDYPLAFIGYYSVVLIIIDKIIRSGKPAILRAR
jgi:hypothetical protein